MGQILALLTFLGCVILTLCVTAMVLVSAIVGAVKAVVAVWQFLNALVRPAPAAGGAVSVASARGERFRIVGGILFHGAALYHGAVVGNALEFITAVTSVTLFALIFRQALFTDLQDSPRK